ncbi:MAG: maleylacetoacetate isomerase [Rhodanobacter sp.]
MTNDLVLYDYWRSSAAYRVRIALNLKQLTYQSRPVHLVRDGGEQHAPDFRRMNPQELVPCLVDGERVLTQSLAIIEYLDEMHLEQGVSLLPADARGRARVRALAMVVACDAHPVGNLRVLQRLESQFGVNDVQRAAWCRHWIAMSFNALEPLLADNVATGRYCHGETPGLADICLVPQVYSAIRWKQPLDAYPTVQRIYRACVELEAFQRAAPEVQPDAP